MSTVDVTVTKKHISNQSTFDTIDICMTEIIETMCHLNMVSQEISKIVEFANEYILHVCESNNILIDERQFDVYCDLRNNSKAQLNKSTKNRDINITVEYKAKDSLIKSSVNYNLQF